MTELRDRIRRRDVVLPSQTLLVQTTTTDAQVLDVGRETDLDVMPADRLAEYLRAAIARAQQGQRGTLTIIINTDRGGAGTLPPPGPRTPGPGNPKGTPDDAELRAKVQQLTRDARSAIDLAEDLGLIGKLP